MNRFNCLGNYTGYIWIRVKLEFQSAVCGAWLGILHISRDKIHQVLQSQNGPCFNRFFGCEMWTATNRQKLKYTFWKRFLKQLKDTGIQRMKKPLEQIKCFNSRITELNDE